MTNRNKTPEMARLRKTHRLLWLIFIAAVILFAVWFFGFCRIKEIDVSGISYCSAEKIINDSGIKLGSHTYAVSKGKIAEKIKGENIYVRSVTVRRTLPKKLHIIIEEYPPAFALEYDGQYFILSDRLTVLEVRDDISSSFYSGTAKLSLSGIKSLALGKQIEFEEKDDCDFYLGIIDTILSSPIGKKLSGIDLRQKFDIHILYNNIYTIVLPSWRTLDSDLSLCIKLITKLESDSYYAGVTGNIRVISDDKVSFQPTGKLGE